MTSQEAVIVRLEGELQELEESRSHVTNKHKEELENLKNELTRQHDEKLQHYSELLHAKELEVRCCRPTAIFLFQGTVDLWPPSSFKSGGVSFPTGGIPSNFACLSGFLSKSCEKKADSIGFRAYASNYR